GSMLLCRYGREFVGRPSMEYYLGSGMDLDDLEIVEYLTTSKSDLAGGADPAAFGTEVSRLDFDIVADVHYQYVDRHPDKRNGLLKVFTREDVLAMPPVPNTELVVLKSKTVDVATAGLA